MSVRSKFMTVPPISTPIGWANTSPTGEPRSPLVPTLQASTQTRTWCPGPRLMSTALPPHPRPSPGPRRGRDVDGAQGLPAGGVAFQVAVLVANYGPAEQGFADGGAQVVDLHRLQDRRRAARAGRLQGDLQVVLVLGIVAVRFEL